jgi:hypothetical protein
VAHLDGRMTALGNDLRIIRLADPPIARRIGVLTRPSEPLSAEADTLRRSIIRKLKEKLVRTM